MRPPSTSIGPRPMERRHDHEVRRPSRIDSPSKTAVCCACQEIRRRRDMDSVRDLLPACIRLLLIHASSEMRVRSQAQGEAPLQHQPDRLWRAKVVIGSSRRSMTMRPQRPRRRSLSGPGRDHRRRDGLHIDLSPLTRHARCDGRSIAATPSIRSAASLWHSVASLRDLSCTGRRIRGAGF